MSVLDELKTGKASACKVCAFLSTMDTATRAEWDEGLALPVAVVSNTAVVATLLRRNVRVDEASVRRHRKNHVGR